ncbi:hypothetical protein ACFVUS_12450 [Nocardia sp. NPDC058058]|uniref:hypothetical protein n=1 Tax=Nocardia sp. NPDC058058 TaxID=3346317 RepID=UPI0036D923D6
MAYKIMNGLDLQSQRIQNVSDPSVSTDAATKNYVDNLINGVAWHQHVRVASTANVTVSGPGTSIDGVTLNTSDRVLLKNQTTASENGVYVFNGSGSALTRAVDGVTGELTANAAFFVSEGTANSDTAWTLTTNDPITVGTTSLAFAQVGGGTTYTAGNGINIASNVVSAVATTGITVGGSGIGVDFSVVPKKYAQTLSTSATSYTITHNLGTQDVVVCVYLISTGAQVWADATNATTNTVTLAFATAPTASTYRVVVIG